MPKAYLALQKCWWYKWILIKLSLVKSKTSEISMSKSFQTSFFFSPKVLWINWGILWKKVMGYFSGSHSAIWDEIRFTSPDFPWKIIASELLPFSLGIFWLFTKVGNWVAGMFWQTKPYSEILKISNILETSQIGRCIISLFQYKLSNT